MLTCERLMFLSICWPYIDWYNIKLNASKATACTYTTFTRCSYIPVAHSRWPRAYPLIYLKDNLSTSHQAVQRVIL